MIMNCAAMVVVGYRPVLSPKCFASTPKINTDQIRYQLDQLHAEAETTRDKASSARLRFLRLSEAAEKLRRQASLSIQRGKENEARDLLFEKKKVMQALEKTKTRIELFDKLSTKLNEVINVKETQLIGNIASDSKLGEEDDSSPIHIISPKEQAEKDNNKNKEFGINALTVTDNMAEQPANEELKKIEQELLTVLNVSTLLLDDEKPKNLKVQQTTELLESILDLRQRVTNIRQMKVEIS